MPAAAYSVLVPFHVLQNLLGWSPRECVERGYGEAASVQRCTESGQLLVLDPSGRVVGRFTLQPVRTATGHAPPPDYEQATWTAVDCGGGPPLGGGCSVTPIT